MGKVGIYSGTFDPVHQGHVSFALAAIEHAQLEKVIFLPERQPRRKVKVTPFDDRLAMLALAIKKHRRIEMAELEQAQFDVRNTLPELQQRFGSDLSLLMGSDVVSGLRFWSGLEKLVDKVEIVVALRHNDSRKNTEQMLTQIGVSKYVCFPSPNNTATSSKMRLDGHKKHLDPSVQAYIAAKRLYPLALAAN